MSHTHSKNANDLSVTFGVSEQFMTSYLVDINILNKDLTPTQFSIKKNYVKPINLNGKFELKYNQKCITYIHNLSDIDLKFISNQLIFKTITMVYELSLYYNKDLKINNCISKQNVDMKLKFDAMEIINIYEDNKNKDDFLLILLTTIESQGFLKFFDMFYFHKDLISLKEKINLETILPDNKHESYSNSNNKHIKI